MEERRYWVLKRNIYEAYEAYDVEHTTSELASAEIAAKAGGKKDGHTRVVVQLVLELGRITKEREIRYAV